MGRARIGEGRAEFGGAPQFEGESPIPEGPQFWGIYPQFWGIYSQFLGGSQNPLGGPQFQDEPNLGRGEEYPKFWGRPNSGRFPNFGECPNSRTTPILGDFSPELYRNYPQNSTEFIPNFRGFPISRMSPIWGGGGRNIPDFCGGLPIPSSRTAPILGEFSPVFRELLSPISREFSPIFREFSPISRAIPIPRSPQGQRGGSRRWGGVAVLKAPLPRPPRCHGNAVAGRVRCPGDGTEGLGWALCQNAARCQGNLASPIAPQGPLGAPVGKLRQQGGLCVVVGCSVCPKGQ